MSVLLNYCSCRSLSICRRCMALRPACYKPPPPPPKGSTVTVLDGSSCVASCVALLLKQNPNISQLRLFDEEVDCTEIYKGLSDIDTRVKVVTYTSSQLREAITNADIVVSTGDLQKKAGQSQRGLFEKNVDNVRNVAIYLAEFNPRAIYCIAKPPVESLVPMVSEEYKKAEIYDFRRIIGVTSAASMIANTLIAKHLAKNPEEVLCPIIGGFSPKTTIPVISQTRPPVVYSVTLYTKLREDIANAEEKLLKIGGSLCFSQAVAVARFVNSVSKALKGDDSCVECAYVAQTGHIGEFLPYMTSIIRLGRDGIASTHMPKMNEQEVSRLKSVMSHILENILLGQTFVSGDFLAMQHFKTKRQCDVVLKQKVKECSMRMQVQG